MPIFDFFKRISDRLSGRPADEPAISRVEYLLRLNHDQLEKPHKAYGGGNFLQLVETQLDNGETDLAIWNLGNQVRHCFELANLYWGQGDMDQAEAYMHKTLERHARLVAACSDHNLPRPSYRGIECAKCAACLLGIEVEDFARPETFDLGYEPWFQDALLSYCIDARDFDDGGWQTSAIAWTKMRHPKYRLEEFSVYIKSLTGQYRSTEAMLEAHEKMFLGRAKRNPQSGPLDGYDDNDLIIDFIFAAILKRIGWEGTYRHSWPNTMDVGTKAETTQHPDRYLRLIAAPDPEPESETGMFADLQAARRFVDVCLKDQNDDEGKPCDARRPSSDRSKVGRALRDLGWIKDAATLDLMQAYRMDRIWNGRTHLFLCDPLDGPIKLDVWTKLLVDDFGLHVDFIAIAGSEEKADYRDPQGSWYVYWKKDGKIYAIDRDEWDRPEVATRNAQAGIDLWPSYTGFVAWWASEHRKSY